MYEKKTGMTKKKNYCAKSILVSNDSSLILLQKVNPQNFAELIIKRFIKSLKFLWVSINSPLPPPQTSSLVWKSISSEWGHGMELGYGFFKKNQMLTFKYLETIGDVYFGSGMI